VITSSNDNSNNNDDDDDNNTNNNNNNITGIYSQFLVSKIQIIQVIIIIIIIIITFAERHICSCPSVKRQKALCRIVCIAAQYAFLILALDGREWSTSGPGRKSPRDKTLLGPRGTAHILGKVLTYKYKTYFTCKVTLLVLQIVNTEQLQHYVS